MNLNSISKKRLYKEIIKQIKASIESGELKPGDKLPSERKLAEELSVSRTTVKEAVSVLESSGIVEICPGIGVFLKDRSEQNIVLHMNEILNDDEVKLVEVMELRLAIESQTAQNAALFADEKDKQVIQEAFTDLEAAVKQHQIAAEEDYEFHLAICRASKNSLFNRVMNFMSDLFLEGLSESRSHTLKTPGKSERILEEHRKIFKAIQESNPEEARTAMIEHLENVKKRYW